MILPSRNRRVAAEHMSLEECYDSINPVAN